MRKTLYLWIGALALLAGIGCKKNSSTAAGSESCLINGEPWVASAAALAASNPNEPAAFTSDDTLFVVNGQGPGNYYSAITIKVSTQGPDFSVGTPIPISGYNTAALLTYLTDSSCIGNTLVNAIAISGSLTITKLDTVHHEIAGTFSATVPLPPCDTVQITDGRFDQYFIEL